MVWCTVLEKLPNHEIIRPKTPPLSLTAAVVATPTNSNEVERLQQALIDSLLTIKKHAVAKLSKAIVLQFTQNALLQQDNTKIWNSNKISKPRRKDNQEKNKAQ